ncbi:hypothetical protein CHS0354_025841 [Potamilus streckersoni]|uniref:WxxW domain-containing protein n=1 Tax=Potamilus streckersoni TaxID=2493646 RepID=A0AAE0SBJ8_9BIVA|nr:hypothetical protein CHS0354_025841 [Potamilus streckersoni]
MSLKNMIPYIRNLQNLYQFTKDLPYATVRTFYEAKTRSSCPSEDWSSWINDDTPSTGDGEYEKMDTKMRTSFCPLGSIQSARCIEVSLKLLKGVNYTCDAVNGLLCRNADNGPTGCPDMKIQYKCTIPCPATTPLLVVTTAQTSPTTSTATKFLTSVTPMTTSTSVASSPLTSLLQSASTTTTDSRTTSLETFSFARNVATTGFPVHSTSTITVTNSTTSVVSSTAVGTTRAMDPSDLPTSTVMLVTGTPSISTPSTVLTSTRKVPLLISTKGYTDLLVSLNSTSFKSTLVMSQSDVKSANG